MTIKLKRAYDPAAASDGTRFLVERLWPRGIKKTDLHVDSWLKDVAPSTDLRGWFAHDPTKWNEFRRNYFHELDARAGLLDPIRAAAREGSVTFVYSARDAEHNAIALKEYFETGRKSSRWKANHS